MNQDNKIILYQHKIIMKMIKGFNPDIKDNMFKGLPMGKLTKLHNNNNED